MTKTFLRRREAARRAHVPLGVIDAAVRTGVLAVDYKGRVSLAQLIKNFPAVREPLDVGD